MKTLERKNVDLITIEDDEIKAAECYFFKKATEEVKQFLKPAQYEKRSKEVDGILRYTGRILPTQDIKIVGELSAAMKDLSSTTFCVPLVFKHSPLAYSLINEVHWYSPAAKHCGIETTWRFILKIAYIVHGRDLVKKINSTCQKCRYLRKKTIDVEMGPVSTHNLTIAPAYYYSQVDLAGPFKAYSPLHKRITIKIWFVVFCCSTTSMTNIKTMDDYSSTSFIQSFIRFSCEAGYPKLLTIDEGSQLVKACQTMKLNFRYIKSRLHKDMAVEFGVCPVRGHNMNSKVERRIKHIKESLEKSSHNERLSILQWETLASTVANSINDLPLALGNITSDYENMDLLTPNRLRLGRNNNRSLTAPMLVTNHPSKILADNTKIFNTWFDVWLVSHVPKLIEQPKWFKTDRDIQHGDVILFIKQDNALSKIYQYGMVHQTE